MTRIRVVGLLLTSSMLLASPLAFAKKKKSAEFVPEEGASGDQPSKVLERAFKLYDGEDFYSASIELNKVIEGESGDSEPNKQKAEFWMGKALYNMKFYSASLSYFDRIVQKGSGHAYYNATLKWLASLSRQLPDSTGILEKIGKYNRAELDQPALEKVRDELYFLLGKFNYQKGNFKQAVELFAAVPTTSEFYVQAKLFEGATHVREYQAKPAVEAFKEVLAHRRGEHRSAHQAVRGPGQPVAGAHLLFDRAIRAGDQVLRPRLAGIVRLGEQPVRVVVGELHAQAAGLLEGAGQHPHDPGAVLRQLHQARIHRRRPDGQGDHLLLQLPLRPRAGSDRRVQRRLPDGVHGAQEGARGHRARTASCSTLAVKIRKETSGLPEQVERAARGVLGDLSLLKRFQYVEELDRELKASTTRPTRPGSRPASRRRCSPT